MTFKVSREPKPCPFDHFLSDEADLPCKIELVDGVVGPFSRRAKLALLSNWGADAIVRLTGPEIWREALKALEDKQN